MATTYAIPDGRVAMAATLYTGNGSTQAVSNAVNGVGFQPDLVWTKARSAAIAGLVYDSVRSATKYLQTNSTAAEGTGADSLTSFNSNGFSVGADTSTTGVNQNGTTYVGWQWKGGGTAVSNTAGSITSSVSANPTAGFSVVTFTAPGGSAQTIGHGLGVAPKMIILKSRNNVSGWSTYHASVGNTGALNLQTTGATSTSIDWWNNTSPTSSVWTIGANLNINTWTFVAYCWSEVAGYSKFGSYTGNGSADGPFVFLGFRPRWVMIKPTSTTGSWQILDTARDTYNVEGNLLWANESTAETSSPPRWDGLSNGFKVRAGSGSHPNVSGETYIYMAFAENPFKYANAR